MRKKVLDYIQKHQLLNNESPVIVGVSGGKDSVVLLNLLHKIGFECIVAHCNFHLRGDESEKDAEFVELFCLNREIKFIKKDFDTLEFASDNKISIEMSARELRYAWFEELRIKFQAQAIAVGHHTDDNAETILLNLIRGSGLKGLTGIKPRNGYIVRPLLEISRNEIDAFISHASLNFREDASNAENIYLRNQIRNQIIPLFEKLNPSFKKNIAETGQILDQYYQFSKEHLDLVLSDYLIKGKDNEQISIASITQSKHYSLLLFHWLNPFGFHADVIHQLQNSLFSEESIVGKIFVSGNHRLLIDRDHLILTSETNTSNSDFFLNIDEIGKNINLPFKLNSDFIDKNDNFQFSSTDDIVHLDADKIVFPIQIRKWRKSDYFYPLGMNKRKKISDLLIDKKINLFDKEKIYVMLSQNDIIWVVGQRIDNRFKITSSTKKIIEFRL